MENMAKYQRRNAQFFIRIDFQTIGSFPQEEVLKNLLIKLLVWGDTDEPSFITLLWLNKLNLTFFFFLPSIITSLPYLGATELGKGDGTFNVFGCCKTWSTQRAPGMIARGSVWGPLALFLAELCCLFLKRRKL